MRTDVNFTHSNKMETLYGRTQVKVKVESRYAYVSEWPSIHRLCFFHARNFKCVRTENYATVEINPYGDRAEITVLRRDQKPHPLGVS